MICPSCGSFRHLLADCPDSYENQAKKRSQAYAAEMVDNEEEEQEEALFTSDFKSGVKKLVVEGEAEDVILYAGNKKKITSLGSECLGDALLDCGCTSNVMGEGWWKGYRAGLSQEDKDKITMLDPAGKKFRFGGEEFSPPSLW